MSTRISSTALPALTVVGCDRHRAVGGQKISNGGRLASTTGGGASRQACRVERAGDVVTIRYDDGAFRRLLASGRRAGFDAADGADAAHFARATDGTIEVAIGAERYRLFPAITAHLWR